MALAGDGEAPSDRVTRRTLGLGQVISKTRMLPEEHLADGTGGPKSVSEVEYSLPYDTRGMEWVPDVARMSTRRVQALIPMLTYAVALFLTICRFRRRRAIVFVAVLPAIGALFALLYAARAPEGPVDLRIWRTRLLTGFAGSSHLFARQLVTVFSEKSDGALASLRLAAAPDSLPPMEFCISNLQYQDPATMPQGPVFISREERSWDIGIRLFPAGLRSFVASSGTTATQTFRGSLELDLAGRRWKGKLEDLCPFDLEAVDVVHGWHHQRLGPMKRGQTFELDVPLVDGGRPEKCPSCGVAHALAGALHDLPPRETPDAELLHEQICYEISRRPEFFAGPTVLRSALAPVAPRRAPGALFPTRRAGR